MQIIARIGLPGITSGLAARLGPDSRRARRAYKKRISRTAVAEQMDAPTSKEISSIAGPLLLIIVCYVLRKICHP